MREQFEAYNHVTGAISTEKFNTKVEAQLWIEERKLDYDPQQMRGWDVRAIYNDYSQTLAGVSPT